MAITLKLITSERDHFRVSFWTAASNGEKLCARGRSGRSVQAQRDSVAAECCDAEGYVGVEIHTQFLRALDDVFTMYTTRESLVFKLLSHTLNVYVEDRFGWLDERNSGQKTS